MSTAPAKMIRAGGTVLCNLSLGQAMRSLDRSARRKVHQTLLSAQAMYNVFWVKDGSAFNIRLPTRRGFKQPKFVTAIYVINRNPGGFWVDRDCN